MSSVNSILHIFKLNFWVHLNSIKMLFMKRLINLINFDLQGNLNQRYFDLVNTHKFNSPTVIVVVYLN